jgi:hypothetical protein
VTINHHGAHAIIMADSLRVSLNAMPRAPAATHPLSLTPQRRAKEGGALVENFCDLARLIRSIQRLEGNPDCFGTVETSCERTGCAWREYCLTDLDRAGLPGETADETAHR